MTDKTVTRERLSDRVDRMADEFFIENSTENDALHAAAADIRALEKSHADLVAALAYIVDEESGWRFRVDPLEHARSVIEAAAKLREADRGENDKAVSAAMRELYVALDALPEGSEE